MNNSFTGSLPPAVKTAVSIGANLLIIYVVYTMCRLEFLLENWNSFSLTMTGEAAWKIFRGGIWFDTSAICYTNILYIVLAMLPFARSSAYRTVTKLSWFIPNAVSLVLNLVDSVYYPYGSHRITTRTFNEFGAEDNLGRIFGIEIINHWYLLLLAILILWGMWKLFRPSSLVFRPHRWWKWLIDIVAIGCVTVFAIWGMRGATFFTSTRPIAVSGAHQFASRPAEANIVLNTPFALIRTINKRPPVVPTYFPTGAGGLDAVFSPVHKAAPDSATVRKKNVVILIVESFATEFIGGLNNNHALDNGTYRGYTEWIDSFIPKTLTWETTIANTVVSIDAMPAILASIPHMSYGFIVSPYSLNDITSFATELGGSWGYHSAFFHGGTNDSMGFQAFAKGAGFKEYYGLDEYCADPRTGGKKDWDGTWAIWDEEFLQYFAMKMSEMPQPFVTGVFTATSHHPFAIPDRYKDRFKDEGQYPLHKCIRYTDYSIGRFFETAAKQPWYDNTIFVLTADHSSSKTTHDEYKTEAGENHVPILIFDPSGEMPTGVMPGLAQQTDILPTILGWLGYDRPFIAYGNDALSTPPGERWAYNWHYSPQLYMDEYYLQTDPDGNATALYNYQTDILMHENLIDSLPDVKDRMQTKMKGILQSYYERMDADSVRIMPGDEKRLSL